MNDVAVITARNEEATIFPLVKALRGLGFLVLVCDDASTDRTRRFAEDAGAHVRHHDTRKGIARSLVELWWDAINLHGAQRLVQLDAGMSHNPGDALGLLAMLDLGADVAIGSRFCLFGHYLGGSLLRRLGSRVMAALCNLAMGTDFSDWSSGYRAFTCKALTKLIKGHYFAKGHAWQMEVLSRAVEAELRIVEFPIVYYAGTSSLHLSGVLEAVNVWLQIFFNRKARGQG